MKKAGAKVLSILICLSMIVPGPGCMPSYADEAGTVDTADVAVEQDVLEEAVSDSIEEESSNEAEELEPAIEEEVTAEEETEEIVEKSSPLETEESAAEEGSLDAVEQLDETASDPIEEDAKEELVSENEETGSDPIKEDADTKEKKVSESKEDTDVKRIEKEVVKKATKLDTDYSKYTTDKIEGDYYRQYAATLLKEGNLKCSSSDVILSIDKESRKMVVSGKRKDIMNSTFTVNKQYSFSGNAVNRFCFEATSEKGLKGVELAFYLDNSTTPFASGKLYKQKKKDTWEFSRDISVDLSSNVITGKHKVSFKVIQAPSDQKNLNISVNYFEFCESSIPVIYFNLDESEGDTVAAMNADEEHETECYGDMTIKVPEGYRSEYTGEVLDGGTYSMEYIRGRGNSTWMASKKPYKIKLDKKADLLGMGKNKHWVLLANYYDNSLLRNKITSWIGNELGLAYTPQSEPVDVIMNGQYLGSYFLSEHVRVGESRVEIDDLEDTPDVTAMPEISGGYLLSIFPYSKDADKETFKTKDENTFQIESPEFNDPPNKAQLDYIQNYIQEVEDAVTSASYKNANGKSYRDLMDMRSTILYYWVQEFSLNGDGYGSSSTYLYKPRGDKLYWGPLWDFDYVAWGSTEYDELYTEGFLFAQDSAQFTWISYLLQDPQFAKDVVKAWPKVKTVMENLSKTGGQLDQYAKKMKISASYNFEALGPSPLALFSDTEEVKLTYDEEIARLKKWITQRIQWVDGNIERLKPVPAKVTYKDYDGKVVATETGFIGRQLKKMPKSMKRKGYVFAGWEYRYNLNIDEYFQELGYKGKDDFVNMLKKELAMTDHEIDEWIEEVQAELKGKEMFYDSGVISAKNMILKAKYVKASKVRQVEKIAFLQNKYISYCMNYEEETWGEDFSIQYEVLPEKATFPQLAWTSSNEKVAEVSEEGYVTVKSPGDAVITATAKNGVAKSCKVHVMSAKEYEKNDYIEADEIEIQEEMTIQKGGMKQLKVRPLPEKSPFLTSVDFVSSDESVATVGNAGVIQAKKAGKAVVLANCMGSAQICRINVTDPAAIGSVVMRKGIQYKVISTKKNAKYVKAIGVSDKSVKSITIPKTIKIEGKIFKVTQIGSEAFRGLKKLNKVVIRRNVEIVGKAAFKNCVKLKDVVIYPKRMKIYGNSFKGISSKGVFQVRGDAQTYYGELLPGKKIKPLLLGSTYNRKGIRYKVTSVADQKVTATGLSKKAVKKVVIPATVRIKGKKYKVDAVGASAFRDKKIRKAVLGRNVKRVGNKAFYQCTALKKITIKNRKMKIGKKAFGKISKKAVFYVPAKAKNYYKGLLKGKMVRSIV